MVLRSACEFLERIPAFRFSFSQTNAYQILSNEDGADDGDIHSSQFGDHAGLDWEEQITHFPQGHRAVDYFPQNQLDFAHWEMVSQR
jgi:hypothetical protein